MVLVAMALTSSAQSTKYYNTRHEIGLSVGAGTNTQVFNSFADFESLLVSSVVTTIVSGGHMESHYRYGNEKTTPAFAVEYFYHVSKVIGIGGYLAYNGMSRDMYAVVNYDNGTSEEEYTGKATRNNFSLIPTVKIDWLRKKHFGMYSKVGLGVSFMNEKQKDDTEGGTDWSETTVIPNLHVSLLGLEAGSESIRGFAELGIGEQGIVFAGVKYKF